MEGGGKWEGEVGEMGNGEREKRGKGEVVSEDYKFRGFVHARSLARLGGEFEDLLGCLISVGEGLVCAVVVCGNAI